MKSIFLSIIFFVYYFMSFAQSTESSESKRLRFGFNLGTHYSQLQYKGDLPEGLKLQNGAGFRLGVASDYKVSSLFFVAAKVELAFNNAQISNNIGDRKIAEYQPLPVAEEFKVHFVFKDENKKFNPYFLVGPNLMLNLSSKNDKDFIRGRTSNLAMDFGIGVEGFKGLASTELRYSYGFVNLWPSSPNEQLRLHTISWVINFMG